jgi:hypothetical protein
MRALFSKVEHCSFSNFDILAEIPVVGLITSAVRLPVSIISFLCNIINYSLISENEQGTKEQSIKDRKVIIAEFGRGLVGIIPIVGRVAAFYFNKEQGYIKDLMSMRDTPQSVLDNLCSDYVDPKDIITITPKVERELDKIELFPETPKKTGVITDEPKIKKERTPEELYMSGLAKIEQTRRKDELERIKNLTNRKEIQDELDKLLKEEGSRTDFENEKLKCLETRINDLGPLRQGG